MLVATVIFAAMSAITWGALSQIARTRGALADQQDRFAAVARTVGAFDRDLRQSISRSVRGNYGEVLPAVLGSAGKIELSRVGFANPQAEPRSNVERVAWLVDQRVLRRDRWNVLDRTATSSAERRDMLDGIGALGIRYLGDDNVWRDLWPPRDAARDVLPRAIEWRMTLEDFGELRRVIVLPSTFPERAAGASPAGNIGEADGIPPIVVPVPGTSP